MIDLKEKEEIIEVVKKSIFILVAPILKSLILALPALYLLFYLDNAILNIVSFVWLLVVISYLFYHLLNWYLDYYIITTQRIIEVTNQGVFSKQITEMPLDRIDNSKCKIKGIFPTLLGFGSVIVYSISKANIILSYIPEPRRIQALISEIKEKQA